MLFAALALCLLAGAPCLSAQVQLQKRAEKQAPLAEQAFRGTIQKKNGKYGLFIPKDNAVWGLDNQTMAEAFAAKDVLVVGIWHPDTTTIEVARIIGALPAQIMQAKSAFLDCYNCANGKNKARVRALQDLLAWKRFSMVGDRRQADLIFLLAANPYRDDYLTAERDTRPEHLENLFLEVIDPHTGKGLWGDSKRWGTLRMSEAAGDLVGEFRADVEAEQGNVSSLLQHYRKWDPSVGQPSSFTIEEK